MMLDPRHAGDACPLDTAFETSADAAPPNAPHGGAGRFLAWIDRADFPCVGAKAALARDAITTVVLDAIGDVRSDAELHAAIRDFGAAIAARSADDTTVYSLAAIFRGPTSLDECTFEAALWSQLQRLHEIDVATGVAWAAGVGTDPDGAAFSLSIGGHAFFVIGLHPGASRLARRYAAPVLVFNSHAQFEELRANGTYRKMQKATRARDMGLQGSINPNLADFGTAPETRQYSGRRVEADWRCPFRVRPASGG